MQPCSNLGAYRIQFLAGHDRAVEKQEYVIAQYMLSVSKKALLSALLIMHQYIASL